jgi:hypothetical protein
VVDLMALFQVHKLYSKNVTNEMERINDVPLKEFSCSVFTHISVSVGVQQLVQTGFNFCAAALYNR